MEFLIYLPSYLDGWPNDANTDRDYHKFTGEEWLQNIYCYNIVKMTYRMLASTGVNNKQLPGRAKLGSDYTVTFGAMNPDVIIRLAEDWNANIRRDVLAAMDRMSPSVIERCNEDPVTGIGYRYVPEFDWLKASDVQKHDLLKAVTMLADEVNVNSDRMLCLKGFYVTPSARLTPEWLETVQNNPERFALVKTEPVSKRHV